MMAVVPRVESRSDEVYAPSRMFAFMLLVFSVIGAAFFCVDLWLHEGVSIFKRRRVLRSGMAAPALILSADSLGRGIGRGQGLSSAYSIVYEVLPTDAPVPCERRRGSHRRRIRSRLRLGARRRLPRYAALSFHSLVHRGSRNSSRSHLGTTLTVTATFNTTRAPRAGSQHTRLSHSPSRQRRGTPHCCRTPDR
jgi:hypothetical protein